MCASFGSVRAQTNEFAVRFEVSGKTERGDECDEVRVVNSGWAVVDRGKVRDQRDADCFDASLSRKRGLIGANEKDSGERLVKTRQNNRCEGGTRPGQKIKQIDITTTRAHWQLVLITN